MRVAEQFARCEVSHLAIGADYLMSCSFKEVEVIIDSADISV
jgi:hypothetical protein